MNADAPNSPPPPAPDGTPVGTPTDEALTGTVPVAPAPATPTAAPAKPATWPEWFPAFDVALAILAVVLAFLMASFVSRNSDLWRHLAVGRLVTQGQYQFGGDTFSFTAENRVWVNAHWLGEAVLYLLFAADQSGAVVVVAKAVAFAAAFGLLFLLRKPGFPLWPWAVAVAAAVVAAGGFTALRPQVFGLPVFAGFLAVLFTGDWAKGSKWKMPAVLGGLTAVWANVDSFAFLSPLLVGLMLAGEWLHPQLLTAANDPPADDPFPTPPPRDALVRALLLCVVGFLLNPTFLAGLAKDPGEAVAQLVPFELDWQAAEDLKGDRDLSRFTYSVFHQGPKSTQADGERSGSGYMDNPAFGKNPSGITTVVLWGVGLLAAAGVVALGVLRGMGVVGWSFGRLGWVLVWLAFTLLAAAVHARFVPYAVMVGVPLLAVTLTALGRRVPPLERLSADAGRGVVMGCQAGRVFSLLAVVLVVVSAVPGWLHPRPGAVGMQRSIGWGVEPDEGMKRAGERFAGWHADPERAKVLADTRGLNTHPDLGDYLAYFAPAEKSFVTSRYRLHRAELKDLVTVRRAVLEGKGEEDKDLQVAELLPLLKRYEEGKSYTLGYVSVAQGYVPIPARAVLFARRGLGADAVMTKGGQLIEALWHVDGRLGVVGRLDVDRGQVRAEAMKWEAAAFAFGPQPPDPAPPSLARGVPPQEGWEYDLLLVRSPLTPIAIEDAVGYDLYADLEQQESAGRASELTSWWMGGTGLIGGGPLLVAATLEGPRGERPFGPLPQFLPQDKEFALPFLIARSARRGLAADPNNVGGYFTLARAFQKPLMPDTEPPRDVFRVPVGSPLAPTELQVQTITALHRAAARMPDPGQPAGRHAVLSLQTRVALLQLYLRLGPPMQAYTFFLQDKKIQAAPGEPSPLGYLDAAHRTAVELTQVADTVSDADLVGISDQLVPLWVRAYQLCERDFWYEFETFVRANRVDPKWWMKIEQRQIFELLIDRKYLAADDDPRKWLEKYVQGQRAGQVDTAALRQRLTRLRDVLDELVRRRADRVNQGTRGRPTDEVFLGYVQSGLPETALKMVLRKEGEASQEVAVQTADVLRLLLWVGRAEEAQQYLDQEVAKGSVDSTSLPPEQRALLRAKFRVIEYELAKLNGDYARADGLFERVLDTPLSDLGAGRPADSLLFGDQWLPAVYHKPLTADEKTLFLQLAEMTLPPIAEGGIVTGGGVHAWAAAQREEYRNRLLFQAFTRYQRGVYALLVGDVARAKEHFDVAVAPQGIPLEKVGLSGSIYRPLGQFLPKYRELLAKYTAKK